MMVTISGYFPEDILEEILLQLPVKSLSRFVCVCKSWFEFIKCDTFIQRHLHGRAEHLLLMYYTYHSCDQMFQSLTDDFTTIVDPNFFHTLKVYPEVIGHCNGIFCLYDASRGRGILWNLANREIRVLPHFPHEYTYSRHWYGLRFGWDERINDYKVVVFSWVHRDVEYYDYDLERRVDIYSLRNDSWKRFQGNVPFYDLENWPYLKCLDGVFYWFERNHETGRILSFHISDEVFQAIIGPDILSEAHTNDTTLYKYNDRLAIIHVTDDKCIGIWVLFESCWNKVVTVGPFTCIEFPLGSGEYGEVYFQAFIRGERFLLIYDPSSQQLSNPEIGCGCSNASLSIQRELSIREENDARFLRCH